MVIQMALKLMTRTVDLTPWELGSAQIKRLSYGEMKQLNASLKELKAKNLPEEEMNDRCVWIWLDLTLVDAPGGTSKANMDTMDGEALAYIAEEAQKYNSPLVVKSRPSSGSASAAPSATPASSSTPATETSQS